MPDSTPPTVRLRLEIHGADDPIRGVLSDDRGLEQPFTGWLALMKRLDALRSGGSHQPTIDAPQSGDNGRPT